METTMLFPLPFPVRLSTSAPQSMETWFGPVTATLPITIPGNSYDSETNDVRAVFIGADGTRNERIAYFDGATWRATLAAPKAGRYRVAVTRNGSPLAAEVPDVTLKAKVARPYVRKGGAWGFVTSDGKSYWPIGYNLAWTNNEVPDLAVELHKMGKSGANWSRIWTSFWDGKAGYMTPEFVKDGTIDLRAWAKWDPIVTAAEEAGVPFQFTLFHHGPWSSTTDSNWDGSPWNAKNGGFLQKPEEFFTNPKAMKLAKAVVRYTVARYGHSPSIMAWELFNEVQWTDGVKRDPESVGRWHDEMSRYIRSLDPYHHLVVTSSDIDLPIWRESDAWEPHAYPPSVGAFMLSQKPLPGKPFFFGEVGPGGNAGGRPAQVDAIRGGIWNALFNGHAGAGEYWYWDRVASQDLRPEYARARAILDRSGVLARGPMPRRMLDLRAGTGSDLTVTPGGGWSKAGQVAFELPSDAGAVAGLPNYYQGDGNRAMMPKSATFSFTAERSGEARVRVAEAAGNKGGNLELRLDGKAVARQEFAAGAKPNATLVAAFGPGRHTLELVNDGADWVGLGGLTFTGIGPTASGAGMSKNGFGMARVLRADAVDAGPIMVSIADLEITGRVKVEVNDLDTGAMRTVALDAAKGRLRLTERDALLVVRGGK